MYLKILSSSSAGNGYLFDNGTEALLVECGVPYGSIQKAVGFDISRLVGAVVSHEHGDHARHVGRVLEARIPCCMSEGTARALTNINQSLVRTLRPFDTHRLGGFTVKGFPVEHDAAEPFGYLIHHEEMGTTLFATDTVYLRYRFEGLSHLLLECNYRSDLLEANYRTGRIPKLRRDRTIASHMSYETCTETLLANDLTKVHHIVLIHLSPGNSHADEFRQGIEALTGKSVHIAERGMTIDFNKTPF